jgi:hypothetical protein
LDLKWGPVLRGQAESRVIVAIVPFWADRAPPPIAQSRNKLANLGFDAKLTSLDLAA